MKTGASCQAAELAVAHSEDDGNQCDRHQPGCASPVMRPPARNEPRDQAGDDARRQEQEHDRTDPRACGRA